LDFSALSRAAGPAYPGPAARARVAALAQSLPARLACSDACEAAEGRIVKGVIDALQRDYPDYPRYQPNAWAKAYRDVQLVFRHNVNAMIRDDVEWLDQSFLSWLRTILQAFVFHSPRFVHDTYVLLKGGARRELPPGGFALLEPFLDRTLAVLSDIPVDYSEGPRPAASLPPGPTQADAAAAAAGAPAYSPAPQRNSS
jgi:hypothetical protein